MNMMIDSKLYLKSLFYKRLYKGIFSSHIHSRVPSWISLKSIQLICKAKVILENTTETLYPWELVYGHTPLKNMFVPKLTLQSATS